MSHAISCFSHRLLTLALLLASALLISACTSTDGNVRRISEPLLGVQQLTVQADGQWMLELRLQNNSSIMMDFQTLNLQLQLGENISQPISQQSNIEIAAESAEVVQIQLQPAPEARVLIADALANGRSISYQLQGSVQAIPDKASSPRTFKLRQRQSSLHPVPGLIGVMR